MTLIAETIFDIRYFTMMLIVFLIYFGCAAYMLQLSITDQDIIEPVFDIFIVDAVITQYLLMLGEFNMDGFNSININLGLIYMLFIISTFYAQITLLNMLIAIMGDTFDRVQE